MACSDKNFHKIIGTSPFFRADEDKCVLKKMPAGKVRDSENEAKALVPTKIEKWIFVG